MKKIYLIIPLMLLINSCASSSHKKLNPKNYIQSTPKVDFNKTSLNISTNSHINGFKRDKRYTDGAIDVDRFKDDILRYINSIRAQNQYCSNATHPLEWNGVLQTAAQHHSKDIALNNLRGHDGSGTALDIAKYAQGVGSKFFERISYFGYPVVANNLIGEAIGIVNTKVTKTNMLYPNFKHSIEILLRDPAHCKIMMEKKFDYVGVGIYKVLNRYYVVYDFAQRAK